MKSVTRSLISVLLASAILPVSIFAGGPLKSIYGVDDRQDYFQASADMKLLADSVVSMWESVQVTADGANLKLTTVNFGKALNLCESERYREQPAGAFCSGTLVGEDIVMTAGHCITDEAKCKDTKFVFGFAVKTDGGAAPASVPAGEVYGCKKIIKRDLSNPPTGIISGIGALIGSMVNGGTGPDYALVQLDRKVTGHKPLPVNRKPRLAKGDKLFVIGHPVGLPVKVAGNAKVRDASPRYFVMTDLDTFGGNSGSAVFNSGTKLIEGILVRGGTDFVKSAAGCTVSFKVGQEEGRGEAVTKISTLSKYIPDLKSPGSKEAPTFQDIKLGGVSSEGMGERVNLQFE